VLLLFAAGLGILLSAVNVYARDTEHLLELVLLAWFWLTPIVYPYRLVGDQLGGKGFLYRLVNPITPIVMTFQRAIYNKLEPVGSNGEVVKILPVGKGMDWYLLQLGVVAAGALVLLAVALRIFGRVEGNFAEEL
jgi:ABC-2 type transport system permease protein